MNMQLVQCFVRVKIFRLKKTDFLWLFLWFSKKKRVR